MRDFLAYAEFDAFWERFHPETPFGREEKEKLIVSSNTAELLAIWEGTETLLAFLQELEQDEVRVNRITHHLKRLPRFPEAAHPIYDEVELFQFKKFLHNYKCLGELLSPRVRTAFAFSYASEGFERRLDAGRQSAESFFIADEYSEELASVRAEIRKADVGILEAREACVAEIQARWGIVFGPREFVLVSRDLLGDPGRASDLLLVEPYDETKYAIRPLKRAEELVLTERRNHLLAKERSCEEAVLEALSHAARLELPRFLEYREVVKAFDLALARARLAKACDLVRPVLTAGPIRIKEGRFLPCEETCRIMDTRYTPLDAVFDTNVTVVFGSNMGGKTVVLKTLAFLQLCAQTGLFVPAAAFETRVFEHFHYLGEGCSKDGAQGLSGFGFEIRQLARAWQACRKPTLALFDEFARTTNSHEAEALLSAVIEAMADNPRVTALFSTHFLGVQRLDQARYLRMRGLDQAGLDFQDAAGVALDERIRLINRRMDHRLVPDAAEQPVSDAIAVAALLGLDPAIAARATYYFQTGNRAQE
jgi:DNA mismatch repair protein MutS2